MTLEADHPRMRGERQQTTQTQAANLGSSPHARGTLDALHRVEPAGRIIPACAGNAPTPRRCAWRHRDHPRMRGERLVEFREVYTDSGSSPHARGTLEQQAARMNASRIIPACAGNAEWVRMASMMGADHPRMRGERASAGSSITSSSGSSPHARGTHDPHGDSGRRVRIIPACAGNAAASRCRARTATDHPRMRGERATQRADPLRGAGSSPHARGTRHCTALRSTNGRIIPACAGNA